MSPRAGQGRAIGALAVTRRSGRRRRTSWRGPRATRRNAGTGTRRAGRLAIAAASRCTARRTPRDMADIRANTVLPALRRDVTLHTADGLKLVGELALPVDAVPAATLVTLHPLPTQGGMMDSHLFRKAANRLPALARLAVLRFNTRGTTSPQGRSDGEFGSGEAEKYDVAAALDLVEYEDLPSPWLVGWSFGTDLAIRYGCDPSVVGAVLLSPPLRFSTDADLAGWARSGKPLVAIVPELDDYLRPPEAAERFGVVPQAKVIGVPKAKHLFVGFTDTVLDAIVDAVMPGSAPLPRMWPVETEE